MKEYKGTQKTKRTKRKHIKEEASSYTTTLKRIITKKFEIEVQKRT